jgi:hypothetical protein
VIESNEPDYANGNSAGTDDGHAIAWALEEIKFELRTANLIEVLKHAINIEVSPDIVEKISDSVMARLFKEAKE